MGKLGKEACDGVENSGRTAFSWLARVFDLYYYFCLFDKSNKSHFQKKLRNDCVFINQNSPICRGCSRIMAKFLLFHLENGCFQWLFNASVCLPLLKLG